MAKLIGSGALTLALLLPSAVGPPGPVAVAPVGGSLFICVASGVLFGASVLTGNALGAAGAVVSAIHNGCL